MSNGKVNGPGTYTFTSGTVWEGNFIDDLLQGNGFKIEKGRRYRVVFKDNAIESTGEEVRKDNTHGRLETATCWYEGDLIDGKAHGYGKLVYTAGEYEGDMYEGEFASNVFNGQGTYTYKAGKNQRTYVGKF